MPTSLPLLGEARPERADAAENRRKVLAAAEALFARCDPSTVTMDAVAAEAGVRTAVLDPLEGLGDETADEDYLSLMRANLAALVRANDCR